MKKNLLIALGVILGLSLIFNVVQLNGGLSKNKKIKSLENSLSTAEEEADTLSYTNSALELDVANLQVENANLIDSVQYLSRVIRSLRKRISKYNERIESMGKAIAFLEQKKSQLMADFDEQIKFGSRQKEQELEDKNYELQQKIKIVQGRVDSIRGLKDALYERVIAKEAEKQRYMKSDEISQQLLDIIEKVEVEFFEILPRKRNKKKAKSARKWTETVINLSLLYKDQTAIEGEEFIVKIIDASTNKIVSPREASHNDTQGITFTFNGNPAPELSYTNYQKKKGKHYIVQVFLIKKQKEYLLSNGTAAIAFK